MSQTNRRTARFMVYALVAAFTAAMAMEAHAQMRTCGPPPPAKPQRRTAGESFPPLPLPATPLRRSEKKREPSPPALIGKVILGDVKWQTDEKGNRSSYRDWMTDPNDVHNLLLWTNQQLHIRYRAVDTDLASFSYDPTELPILYFTGHDAFTVKPELIAKLRQYCVDGGTILGDACCGSPDFDKAFRALAQELFPKRPMEPIPADHPLYSSFFPISSVRYAVDTTEKDDVPHLEAVSIGCRAAIIYGGGYDLSCGWDGHIHGTGKRYLPASALKIGANIITYTLATYELGRFLATEKIYHQKGDATRDQLVIAQVVHGGDWDTQPASLMSLMKYLAENTTVSVQFKKEDVDLKSIDAFRHPILYITGHDDFKLTDEEVTNLRRYLSAGGVLVGNACCGRKSFDTAFRREIARVLPDGKLDRVALDHPIYKSVFPIQKVEYTPLALHDYPGLDRPTLEGIQIDNQLRVIYSPMGLVNGWSGAPNPYDRGYAGNDALRLGINILVYAMTH